MVEEPKVFEFASDKQQEAVEAPPGAPLLLIGGFNSGKTTAAILRALSLCQTFPGYKVAVLRKTFNDLKLTTRPSFDQWLTGDFVEASNEKEVKLKNGSSFVFHHLDRPDSATILKGLEINAAILDQAEQMQEQTFTILLGRLGRWKGAKVPPYVVEQRGGINEWPWKDQSGNAVPPLDIILTANPSEDGDPELHWLWQRFSQESPAFHKKWVPLGYRSMVMPTYDNKFAGEQNVAMLNQQDEEYRMRFVEGKWVKSKGHLFRLDESSLLEYDPDLMVQLQNNMNLGRVLDHGDSAPTCCLWYSVDSENNLFVWQEYYQAGVTESGDFDIADHRRAITQLSRPLTFRTNLADPSIFNRTRGITGYDKHARRWSVADEYKDNRIIQEDTAIIWKPADNNEALSRSRLKQYLKVDKYHHHPVTGELGAPHLYFVKQGQEWPHGVRYAVNEIRAAKRIKVGEADGKPIYGDDRDPEIPDHSLDCIRYLVNSRPLPASYVSTHSPTREQKAYAGSDGRVLVTVPALKTTGKRYINLNTPERGSWKSRGGGY